MLGIMLHCRGHGEFALFGLSNISKPLRPTPITLRGTAQPRGCHSHLADDMEASQSLWLSETSTTHPKLLAQPPRHTASHISHFNLLELRRPSASVSPTLGVDEDLAWQELVCSPNPHQHCCLPFLASVLGTYSPPRASMAPQPGAMERALQPDPG